jgi:nitric oxide reductase activation protein
MLTRFLKVKSFNEPMSSRVHQRLNWIETAGLTRIGAAVRHATDLLLAEKYNTHRLILLLSDGFAYDDEYEGKYAEADTLKSLEEARARGIACVCVNIGTSKDDEALKRVYGESTYLRIAHASGLPGRLRRMMNTAIYQASQSNPRRRRAQQIAREGRG